MAICAHCGTGTVGDLELCPYHGSERDSDWALGNKIVCDWIHRGIIPPRLPEPERTETIIDAFGWGA